MQWTSSRVHEERQKYKRKKIKKKKRGTRAIKSRNGHNVPTAVTMTTVSQLSQTHTQHTHTQDPCHLSMHLSVTAIASTHTVFRLIMISFNFTLAIFRQNVDNDECINWCVAATPNKPNITFARSGHGYQRSIQNSIIYELICHHIKSKPIIKSQSCRNHALPSNDEHWRQPLPLKGTANHQPSPSFGRRTTSNICKYVTMVIKYKKTTRTDRMSLTKMRKN